MLGERVQPGWRSGRVEMESAARFEAAEVPATLAAVAGALDAVERGFRELERRAPLEPWSLLGHWRRSALRARFGAARRELEAIRGFLSDLDGTLAYDDCLANPHWKRWAAELTGQVRVLGCDVERELRACPGLRVSHQRRLP